MLEWNAAYYSLNGHKLKTFNVLNHVGLRIDLGKLARKRGLTREQFEEGVRKELIYHFWSKCEWEFVISEWPPNEKVDGSKVDVFDQIWMNKDRFVDYLWKNRAELKTWK